MRSTKEQKGRIPSRALATELTDEQLKAARGGTNSPTPPFIEGGGGQSPNARAVVIEDGSA
jgi:hypothetical protein